MKFRLFASALTLCGLFAAIASAQNPMPKLPNLPAGQLPPGQQLNPNQAAANQAAIRQMMMQKFDLDRDGKLSPQEQLAATRAMQQQGLRVPGAPNLAGPGSNNGPQTGPGQPQAQPEAKAPKLSRREEILMKRFDKDGDGKLSDEEKAAARAELGQKNKADKK